MKQTDTCLISITQNRIIALDDGTKAVKCENTEVNFVFSLDCLVVKIRIYCKVNSKENIIRSFNYGIRNKE